MSVPGPLRHSYVRRATVHAHTIPNLKPEIWTKHCVTPSSISYVSYFISLSSLSLSLLEPDQSSSMYGDFGVMISGRRKARADRSERVTDWRTSRSSAALDGIRERGCAFVSATAGTSTAELTDCRIPQPAARPATSLPHERATRRAPSAAPFIRAHLGPASPLRVRASPRAPRLPPAARARDVTIARVQASQVCLISRRSRRRPPV